MPIFITILPAPLRILVLIISERLRMKKLSIYLKHKYHEMLLFGRIATETMLYQYHIFSFFSGCKTL